MPFLTRRRRWYESLAVLAADLHWPLLDVLQAHELEPDRLPLVVGDRGTVLSNQSDAVC